MKKKVFISALLISIAFYACKNDSAKEEYKTNVNNLALYVDSVDKLQPVYTESQWSMIDDGYNTRLAKIDRVEVTDAGEKAKLEESETKYKSLKDTYQVNIQKAKEKDDLQAKANKASQDLRNQLLGEAAPAAADNWNFVTPQNIVSIYENFVDKVRRNGDNYTEEEWNEVRSLWKGPNARKDEIEKDMSGKDNAKVAGLRVAFTAVKSVSKPLSKIKEEVRENKK